MFGLCFFLCDVISQCLLNVLVLWHIFGVWNWSGGPTTYPEIRHVSPSDACCVVDLSQFFPQMCVCSDCLQTVILFFAL